MISSSTKKGYQFATEALSFYWPLHPGWRYHVEDGFRLRWENFTGLVNWMPHMNGKLFLIIFGCKPLWCLQEYKEFGSRRPSWLLGLGLVRFSGTTSDDCWHVAVAITTQSKNNLMWPHSQKGVLTRISPSLDDYVDHVKIDAWNSLVWIYQAFTMSMLHAQFF
jgi:hypothetical protein